MYYEIILLKVMKLELVTRNSKVFRIQNITAKHFAVFFSNQVNVFHNPHLYIKIQYVMFDLNATKTKRLLISVKLVQNGIISYLKLYCKGSECIVKSIYNGYELFTAVE